MLLLIGMIWVGRRRTWWLVPLAAAAIGVLVGLEAGLLAFDDGYAPRRIFVPTVAGQAFVFGCIIGYVTKILGILRREYWPRSPSRPRT